MPEQSLLTKAVSDESMRAPVVSFFHNMTNSTSENQLDTLANGVILQRMENRWLFEGDIAVDERNLPFFEELGTRSAFRSQAQYYWPMRKVFYKYHSSFDNSYQSMAEYVMSAISSICGVSFELAGQSTNNYILFKYSSSGNDSPVGMVGGEQIINIHDNYAYVIAHEILHSLGFFHEHSRPDRSNYIMVDYDNIRPSWHFAFNTFVDNGYQGATLGSFDFGSIMLYGSICDDPNMVYNVLFPVMTKLDGSSFPQPTSLSSGDIDALKGIYGPPYHRMEKKTLNVITDYQDNTSEIYEAERKAYICFYSSPSCNTRMQTTVPRRILIRKYVQSCTSYNQLSSYYVDQQILVPAGVDSVFVDQYTNYEEYLYSNPLSINSIDYEIVNSHVSSISQ